MSRNRMAALVALAVVALSLVPLGASADHCGDNIYVFSRTRVQTPAGGVNNPSVTSEAIGCTVLGDVDGDGHEEETRWIYPAANSISVRYLVDFGAGVTTLTGTVSGLGANQSITLTRTALTGGTAFAYDSASVAIDPSQTGTLTVTVTLPDATVESDTYSTIS